MTDLFVPAPGSLRSCAAVWCFQDATGGGSRNPEHLPGSERAAAARWCPHRNLLSPRDGCVRYFWGVAVSPGPLAALGPSLPKSHPPQLQVSPVWGGFAAQPQLAHPSHRRPGTRAAAGGGRAAWGPGGAAPALPLRCGTGLCRATLK